MASEKMKRDYCKIGKNIALIGFFSEYLPPCFLLPSKILNCVPPNNCDLVPPISYTMSRFNNNNARRTICIPEIGSYISAYTYMQNQNIIQELIEFTESSSHSYSPILGNNNSIVRHEQAYGDKSSNKVIPKSEYINNIGKKIIYSSGSKKVLKLDISNCFSSFYMHMIPAIFLGADVAKIEYNKFITKKDDPTINPIYIKYSGLDNILRKQNLNRTNGLLTGILSSKIIAEAILTRIDKELDSCNIKFARYVDDYEIFLYGDDEKKVISEFTAILNKYGFSLNTEKTEIINFPYYIVENFEKILSKKIVDPIDSSIIIDLFNSFFSMEDNGVKGAIRYLLKSFEQNPPEIKDPELYKAYLIAIMANNERSLTKSCSILILEKDKYILTASDIKNITQLLQNHMEFKHDMETIWLLYLLIETGNIKLGDNIIIELLRTHNELAYSLLLRKGLFNESDINNVKNCASSWLLLYELFSSDIITEEEFTTRLCLKKNIPMYRKLKKNKIHFIT